MNKTLLTVVIILCSLVLMFQLTKEEEYRRVHINSQALYIPPKYLLDNSIFARFSSLLHLDKLSSSLIVSIPNTEIETRLVDHKLEAKNQFMQDFSVLLSNMTDSERERMLSPKYYIHLEELWNNEGTYKNRVIEKDEVEGWVRVYRDFEYPDNFVVIKADLNQKLPSSVADIFVASCLMRGSKQYRGFDCRSFTLVENILIEFYISKTDLHKIDEVSTFLRDKVKLWRDKKDGISR